jgi:GT2 family glycosyltransferase
MTGSVGPGHPPVHCVLLNYKGWRDTIACLESLLRSDYPALRVVIVDNASPDDSVERILAWARGEQEAPAAEGMLAPLVAPAVRKPVAVRVVDGAEWSHGVAPLFLSPIHPEERRDEGPGVRSAVHPEERSDEGPCVPAEGPLDRDARSLVGPAGLARDGTAPCITLIRAAENRGFTGGNNVGLRYLLGTGATGYAWVLNNDTLVAADTASRLVATAGAMPRCGAVGATLLEFREPEVVQAASGGTVTRWHGMVQACAEGVRREALPAALPRLDFVSGCSFLVPLAVLREVGLLDERLFIYAEDIDWSVRIAEAGYPLGWARDAWVWHKGGGATGHGSPVHDYHNIRSSLLFVRKHHPRLVPLALGYVLYRAVLPKVVRRQWERLRAVGRGVRDYIRDRHLMGAAV